MFRGWCDQPKCWPQEGQSWSSSYVADRHHGQGRSGWMGSCNMTSLDGSRLAAVPSSSAVKIVNKSRLLNGPEATVEAEEARGKDLADPGEVSAAVCWRVLHHLVGAPSAIPVPDSVSAWVADAPVVLLWVRRRVIRFPSRLDLHRASGIGGPRETGNGNRETGNWKRGTILSPNDHCLASRRDSARTR